MIDFSHVLPIADTAYCVVHEASYAPPSKPGFVQKCALKTAKREDASTRKLLAGEYERLCKLVTAGRPDETPLVPRPLALEVVDGKTQLLMEWVDGVALDDQTSRGEANPAPPLYAVESLRRLVTLLSFVHRKDGLNASLPDFKRDAIILATRGLRVLDWNVLHEFSEDGAARDFRVALQYMVELAIGMRVGSFASASESLHTLQGSLEAKLLRTLLEYVITLATHRPTREQLLHTYEKIIDLCDGYEQALLYLQWVALGVEHATALKAEVAAALDAAITRSGLSGPPSLELAPRTLKLTPRSPVLQRRGDSKQNMLSRALTLFAEAGAIPPDHLAVLRVATEVENLRPAADVGAGAGLERPRPSISARPNLPGPPRKLKP